VIPAVFAEEAFEFRGGVSGGHRYVDFFAELAIVDLQALGSDFYFWP
jgi:hypothetical protein